MYHGIINVYKEPGYTSHDVVARLRGILKQKKIGHTGTLDPMATGVLPVFVGRATRAVEFASEGQKEYLAGLRLGFAIGSAELIRVLEAVKNSYNSYTVDNLSLLCGAAAMDDEAYFAKTTAAVITTRERVHRALEQMGFSVLPSRTNFLFATKDGASMRELFLYLKQRHIYIRYFDLPRIDNYVRITIGTDAQMDAFLQGTEAFLRGE